MSYNSVVGELDGWIVEFLDVREVGG